MCASFLCDHVTVHVEVHAQDNVYLINMHEVDIILIVSLHMTYDLTVYISICCTSGSAWCRRRVVSLSCTFQRRTCGCMWYRRRVVSLSCTFQRAVLAALCGTDGGSCLFQRGTSGSVWRRCCLCLFLVLNVVYLLFDVKLRLFVNFVGMTKQVSDGKEIDILNC